MTKRIAIIQGHPDTGERHLCHALADAYAEGARTAGHEVRRIDAAALDMAVLRSKQDFETGEPPPDIRAAQETIAWASHLVILHPLWMGMVPALLKAFLEQVLRPGFAYRFDRRGRPERLLTGRSARIVVTMGMPALAYRWLFGAHGVKALRRSVLWLCGIAPVRTTLIGSVDSGRGIASRWQEKLRELGHAAA